MVTTRRKQCTANKPYSSYYEGSRKGQLLFRHGIKTSGINKTFKQCTPLATAAIPPTTSL